MKKRLNVALSKDQKQIEVMGVDSNGAPYSLYEKVLVSLPNSSKDIKTTKMPYKMTLPDQIPDKFDIRL